MQYSDLSMLVQSGALNEIMNKQLPGLIALNFQKVLKEVQDEWETFMETRNDLVDQYSEDGEIDQDSENWEEFQEEIEDMLEAEVGLDAEPVPVGDWLANIEVSAGTLNVLMEAGVLVEEEE